MTKSSGLFATLQHRRVFRVCALYVVGAWVVLQVADLAFPGFQIPESSIRYVWAGAFTMFPLALLLGWRYDISHGQLVRSGSVIEGHHHPLNRTDMVLLSGIAVAFLSVTTGLLIEIANTRVSSSPGTEVEIDHSEIDSKSIAILPFTNLSGEASNEPFTLGIHDDVLTHVSKISGIKVISRTSVMRLDDGISIPEIGRLLGVATVLESGMQRIGDRIRINTQLIDASSDQHLWAETFDRELTPQNVFEIQTEIALAITEKLRASLSPQDEISLAKIPTRNLPAYEAYLLGRQRMATRTRDDLLRAADYFQQAVDLDPQYALAFLGLADANLLLGNYGFLSIGEALANAEIALGHVLALDDQLGAAHASVGLSLVQRRDFTGAEASFRRAIELDPNYSAAYHWYGDVLISALGRSSEAIPLLEKARALDPLSPTINVTLGEALEGLGRFDEAMDLYRKALEIEPNYPSAHYLIGSQYRSVLARLDEAVVRFHQELSIDPARDSSFLALAYLDLGDPEKTQYWIDRAMMTNSENFMPYLAQTFLHRQSGDQEKALQGAQKMLEIAPGNNASLATMVNYGLYAEVLEVFLPLYPELSCEGESVVSRVNLSQAINLSLAMEHGGDPECAGRLLEKAMEQIEEMPRLGLRGFGNADVEILARQGKTRQALDTLRVAFDGGFRAAWWLQTEGSPHMISLFDEPEFIAMMDEIRAETQVQLTRVRELERGGELAPVPAP